MQGLCSAKVIGRVHHYGDFAQGLGETDNPAAKSSFEIIFELF